LAPVLDSLIRAATPLAEQENLGCVMKSRITDDNRFLGLDFTDWSMLVVGFTLAGLLALYI
jgi:hypothetical protein